MDQSWMSGSKITVEAILQDANFGVWNGDFFDARQFGVPCVGNEAVDTPELASFFVEEPAFLLGCFDNATGKKRTVVLIGSGADTEPVKKISTYVTLNRKHYSQHL